MAQPRLRSPQGVRILNRIRKTKPLKPTSLKPESLYQRKEGVYSSELDSETVLLDQTQGLYFGLQGIGVRVWQCLEKPITLAQIKQELCRELEALPESFDRDIDQFLLSLLEAHLIQDLEQD